VKFENKKLGTLYWNNISNAHRHQTVLFAVSF